MKRTSTIKRTTTETDITVSVNLDGRGKYKVDTGIGFLNHMLELLSKHSLIDLTISAKGDLWVDEHHTAEDIGLCLGAALRDALGNKKGIQRYGFTVPMDETLADVVIDLGGRSYLVWNANFKREKIGDLPTELLEHFFKSIADSLGANIHVNLRYGNNEHHKSEAIFKAFARALRFAVSRDPRAKQMLPSTKGKL